MTNPPFKLAAEFVANALELCPIAIMLLRLSFLESMRRTAILDSGHLTSIHVHAPRRVERSHGVELDCIRLVCV